MEEVEAALEKLRPRGSVIRIARVNQ